MEGSTGTPSPTQIGLIGFLTTVVVIGVLFAVGVLPLWLAGVIVAADAAFTYLFIGRMGRAT